MEPEKVVKIHSQKQVLPVVVLLKDCPLCDSDNLRPVLSERNTFPDHAHSEVFAFHNQWVQLLECQDCHFAFAKEIPADKSFFQKRYDNTWFDPEFEVGSVRKSEILEDIFRVIKKYQPEGKLLDVGSFAGKLLHFAKDKGYTPEGVEVNPKLAKFTEETLGFHVYNSEIQNVELPSNYFEVVTIIDVLEHLVGPRDVLLQLYKTIRPGGLLIIKVPNYRMQKFKQWVAQKLGVSKAGIFNNFGHINQFSPRAVRNVVEHMGLDLLHVHVAKSEKWQPDSFVHVAKNFAREFYWRFASIVKTLTGINLGLNLVYVARKRIM